MKIQWHAKRRLVVAAFIILTAGIVWIVRLDLRGAPPSTNGAAAAIPPKAERRKMQWADQIQLLERHGEVPEDADVGDWQMAERTTWWGKPIDPKTFWKGRTLWLDAASQLAARKQGRMYPPIPYEDSRLPHSKDENDEITSGGEVDGASLRLHVTDREIRFWDKFQRTKPKPPDQIESEQIEVAEGILRARRDFENAGDHRPATTRRRIQSEKTVKDRAVKLGAPVEALSDETLSWVYLTRKKQEYQQILKAKYPTNSPPFRIFFFGLVVDPKLVTNPPTENELKAANAWKFAYLQRLRREKTDESYINAYLKAWNLSREEVFGESQR